MRDKQADKILYTSRIRHTFKYIEFIIKLKGIYINP
jgi:hypothetical protein